MISYTFVDQNTFEKLFECVHKEVVSAKYTVEFYNFLINPST